MALAAGTRLQHYEIIARLGAGGMGEVYEAEDLQLRRRLALKVLVADVTDDAERVRRFEQEAHAASALNHPNIVTIYGLGASSDGRFIAMELVRGTTLREIAKRPSDIDTVVDIGRQIAEALAVAHAAGITHRDIKPENIMLREDGYVKVLDFGLARLIRPSGFDGNDTKTMGNTTPGTVLGTLRYMSPEQANGHVASMATDVFSLGLVLYELAAGRHAFAAAAPLQVLHGIMSEEPVTLSAINPEVPESLNLLTFEMLRKDPAARPTAADVAAALADLAGRVGARQMPRELPHAQVAVGRERELGEIRSVWDEVVKGQGRLASIGGEAGAGKTTLVDQFLSDVAAMRIRCRVARGRCSERLAGTEAYAPWLDLFGALVRDSTGSVARAMKALAPTWYQQVTPRPSSDSVTKRAEPAAASQERLKRELAALLEELGRDQPLVLAIDDLHWADDSTVELLSFVADHIEHVPVLIIATYRPTEVLRGKHPFGALRQALQSRRVCHDITVGFLTSDDVARYLSLEFSNHSFPEELAARVYARTEGNPLFMADLVRYLRDRGVIARRDDRWVVEQSLDEVGRELPESVRGMIERKIEQLGDDDRRLLAVASVQGYEFDSTIVAEAVALDPADVEERLHELDRVHAFVRMVDERELADHTLSVRYRFVHVLYQHALFASYRPTRKAQVAATLAAALERHAASRTQHIASELAVLFETARQFDKAADYYRIAAENAARIFASRESMALARHALTMLEKLPRERARLERELATLVILGNGLIATGGYSSPAVEDAYARASELCDSLGDSQSPYLLPAVWGSYQFKVMRARFDEILGRRDELLRKFEQDKAMVVAHRVVGQAYFFKGDLIRGREYFEKITTAYEPKLHQPLTWLYAQEPGMAGHALLGMTLWLLGYPDQGLVHNEQSQRIGRQVPQHNSRVHALIWAGVHHQFRREPLRQGQLAAEAIALATEQGLKFWLAIAAIPMGAAMIAQGRFDEGLATIRRGIAGYRAAGAELLLTFNLCNLATACEQASRPEEGLDALAEAEALMTSHGERFYEAELRRLRGALLVMTGAPPDGAEKEFEEAIAVARRQQARSLELRATTSLARLWSGQGRREAAHARVAAIYGWFTEGFDTVDLQEAKALLAQLATR